MCAALGTAVTCSWTSLKKQKPSVLASHEAAASLTGLNDVKIISTMAKFPKVDQLSTALITLVGILAALATMLRQRITSWRYQRHFPKLLLNLRLRRPSPVNFVLEIQGSFKLLWSNLLIDGNHDLGEMCLTTRMSGKHREPITLLR